MKKPFEFSKPGGKPRYWHDRLSDAVKEKAGRLYDRLKGLDKRTDTDSKEHFIDQFRMEMHPEVELGVYDEILAAVEKVEREHGKRNPMQRQAIYYLALNRSLHQDPDEAFRATEENGFRFAAPLKKPILEVIDSCVHYAPLTVVPSGPVAMGHFTAEQFGKGKSRHNLPGDASINN